MTLKASRNSSGIFRVHDYHEKRKHSLCESMIFNSFCCERLNGVASDISDPRCFVYKRTPDVGCIVC